MGSITMLAIAALRTVLSTAIGLAVALGLIIGGFDLAPRLEFETELTLAEPIPLPPPKRPPLVPPAVPIGAPEEWAAWTYFDKIAPLWENDWVMVIALLEELRERYPGNTDAIEKLYAAYIARATQLGELGDGDGARRLLRKAIEIAPDRGEAPALLKLAETQP